MTSDEAREIRAALELLRQRVDRLTYAVIALACLGGGASWQAIQGLLGAGQ